jgi:hypothetical protein
MVELVIGAKYQVDLGMPPTLQNSVEHARMARQLLHVSGDYINETFLRTQKDLSLSFLPAR